MYKLMISLVIFSFLAGCQQQNGMPKQAVVSRNFEEKKGLRMSMDVIFKLGELGADFKKRYPQVIVEVQPAGLDFYTVSWPSSAQGTVKFEHGKYSFDIENVLSLLTSQDTQELAAEGFKDVNINAGMSDNSSGLIPHAQARDKIYALLKQIEARGWKLLTAEDTPRLKGKHRFDFVMDNGQIDSLGTDYIPTLEEWMRIDSLTRWHFYADHQFLTASFTRERSLTDPTKPGAYLLSFELKSEAQHYRTYVGPDNRARWQALLPTELATLKQNRAKTEAALKAQGIKIDETYQDPPLPAFMQ